MTDRLADKTHLEVMTLNCWGLKYLAQHRRARLAEIGSRIASRLPPLDIVALQECWTQEDFLAIRERTKASLAHAKFYHCGVLGAGLAILSRWPIVESAMHPFVLNGRPTAFFRGDWYAGKGVASALIQLGPRPQDLLEFFCTHLHAPYEPQPHDSYLCHRTAQAWQLARMMRHAAQRGHLVLAMGDFNMVPDSLAHRLITGHAPVRDVWQAGRPEPLGDGPPTIEEALERDGVTCDSGLNTWRWSKTRRRRLERGLDVAVDKTAMDSHGKRLDYIFFGPDHRWQVQQVQVGMTLPHPALRCSLSDHFSVEARLTRQDGLDADRKTMTAPLPLQTYDDILAIVASYMARETSQRLWRLGHLVLQICLTLACLVAVWWSPRPFVSFILMLLSTLGLSAGVFDGLIGGLFMTAELNALREFRCEIERCRATLLPPEP